MITKAQWCNHHAEGKGEVCGREHHQGEGNSNVRDAFCISMQIPHKQNLCLPTEEKVTELNVSHSGQLSRF